MRDYFNLLLIILIFVENSVLVFFTPAIVIVTISKALFKNKTTIVFVTKSKAFFKNKILSFYIYNLFRYKSIT